MAIFSLAGVSSGAFLIRALITFKRVPTLGHNQLPKTPPPKTSLCGIEFQQMTIQGTQTEKNPSAFLPFL